MRLTPTRLLRRLRGDARGSALIPAIGIAMITLVIAATLTAATMTSLSRTDDTRDAVAADFAAEAGITVARQSLAAGGCDATTYESAVEPFYRAAIVRVTANGGEELGCPEAGGGYRIVSTGYADARAFEARAGGRTVEATYIAGAAETVPVPGGPALYAYSSESMGGSGKLLAGDAGTAAVHVRHGDVTCSGAGAGEADWVTSGRFTVEGSCVITGDVWAGSAQIIGGGRIDGQLVAAGDVVSAGHVRDSLWAGGAVELSGGGAYVGGDVAAATLRMSGSAVVEGTARIDGAVTMTQATVRGSVVGTTVSLAGTVGAEVRASGDVTLTEATVGGSVVGADVTMTGNVGGDISATGDLLIPNAARIGGGGPGNVCVGGRAEFQNDPGIRGSLSAASVTAPAWVPYPAPRAGVHCDQTPVPPSGHARPETPAVADWVDLPWDLERWGDFTLVDLGSQCDFDALKRAVDELAGRPGILDARECIGGFALRGEEKLPVKNDLAIFAHRFALGESGGFAGDGDPSLWLINPDDDASTPTEPTCAGQSLEAGGAFTFSGVHVMLYSPCKVTIASGLSLEGQVYAGEVDISGAATIVYTPSGLPGLDLGGGSSTVPAASPPSLASYRSVSESAERWF